MSERRHMGTRRGSIRRPPACLAAGGVASACAVLGVACLTLVVACGCGNVGMGPGTGAVTTAQTPSTTGSDTTIVYPTTAPGGSRHEEPSGTAEGSSGTIPGPQDTPDMTPGTIPGVTDSSLAHLGLLSEELLESLRTLASVALPDEVHLLTEVAKVAQWPAITVDPQAVDRCTRLELAAGADNALVMAAVEAEDGTTLVVVAFTTEGRADLVTVVAVDPVTGELALRVGP